MSPGPTTTPARASAASRSSGKTPSPGSSQSTPRRSAISKRTPRPTTPEAMASTLCTVAPSVVDTRLAGCPLYMWPSRKMWHRLSTWVMAKPWKARPMKSPAIWRASSGVGRPVQASPLAVMRWSGGIPKSSSRWRVGMRRAHDTGSPTDTSRAARRRCSAVMRLSVPSSSSGPHRPQLLHDSKYDRTSDSVGTAGPMLPPLLSGRPGRRAPAGSPGGRAAETGRSYECRSGEAWWGRPPFGWPPEARALEGLRAGAARDGDHRSELRTQG